MSHAQPQKTNLRTLSPEEAAAYVPPPPPTALPSRLSFYRDVQGQNSAETVQRWPWLVLSGVQSAVRGSLRINGFEFYYVTLRSNELYLGPTPQILYLQRERLLTEILRAPTRFGHQDDLASERAWPMVVPLQQVQPPPFLRGSGYLVANRAHLLGFRQVQLQFVYCSVQRELNATPLNPHEFHQHLVQQHLQRKTSTP